MKIIQVKITLPEEKNIVEPDYHFCYQCKHFIRHFIKGYSGRNFTPLEWGHCYPPKKYAHLKQRKATDCACLWFEETKEDT